MRIVTADKYSRDQSIQTIDLSIDRDVQEIINGVRANGDRALFKYTERFDNVKLDQLQVTEEEFSRARKLVDDQFLSAIKDAIKNITYFHEQQREKSWFYQQENNIVLGQKITPIDRVGIYIPGGTAAYPSTVMMNVIPAKIAEVPEISIVTPPRADGTVNPHVLVTAELTGVDRIYKVGGAQAIAALAYGTESIDKVYKIVGPGNQYVASAKKIVYGEVDIDMIAGPSEICIVADKTASPTYVAADLLSQAEHDEQAIAVCITADRALAEQIQTEVNRQKEKLERRDIIEKSLENNGRIIVTESLDESFNLVNELAPEHLQLMIKDAPLHISDIRHAGAIFVGNYSPEPLGDYYAGPNHTLPTSGTAKFSSPLGVYDFVKRSSIIHYSKEALNEASDQIMTIAKSEHLTAHARSIEKRKEDL